MTQPNWKVRRLKLVLLQLAILQLTVACGGGYGGDDNPPVVNNPPPPATADARFADDTIEGLGFSVQSVVDGKTDATGAFKIVSGRRVDFFVGDNANHVTIGSATPTAAASGALSFSLNDLAEVQGNNGEQVLGNVVNFLSALDANGDIGDGIQIDGAANTAVAAAVTGGKTVNFNQAAATFAADPVVTAVLTALNHQLIDVKEILAQFTLLFRQSRSSTIALTSDDKRAVVVNRQKDSVSVIRVRKDDGTDASDLIGEVKVGREPRFVAISPDDKRAYVTNAIDGTMTIIDLTAATPVAIGQAVDVGVEPRGIALTPNGQAAFVANNTTGDVTIVRLDNNAVIGKVHVGGNPYSVAITNNGNRNDADERVFVSEFFGELIDPARPDGFDDSKQGVVVAFNTQAAVNGNAQISRLLLKPLGSGFAADRGPFCLLTRQALQAAGTTKFFNSGALGADDGASKLANSTFCPDANIADPANLIIKANPQKVYPNQLHSVLLRGSSVYVANVGAQPEPPVRFNVNVQGLVGVLNRVQDKETDRSVNLNTQIAKETQPVPAEGSLDRLFLNDLVAIDADRSGRNFLAVSRGGNYVLRAKLGNDGKLSILDANNKAQRLETGNLPSGVVMSRNGKRAYTNNELSTSVTALNLENNTVIARDINSSEPPAPGSPQHRKLLGKLAFFTALGIPDKLDTNGDGQYDVALRDIEPVKFRNLASDNGWSGCGSCHEDGHSDNVTWIFETGPRQTIPLEGTFARNDLTDQRLLNWSAVRGSNTDFNNNAKGIQGGKGFATNVDGNGLDRTAQVFNHGPTKGISDSLDAMSEWVATVRAPIVPVAPAATAAHGKELFATNCASCHGGKKWTKSRSSPVFQNNPTFAFDPIGPHFFDVVGTVKGVPALDAGVAVNGPQIISVTRAGKPVLTMLDNVGTFNAASPIEIRGAAAVAGQTTQGFAAFGALGFNSPSLLGLSISAPYFHDGSAQTLEDVAARHKLPAGQTIAQTLSAADAQALLDFVRSIDDATDTVASDTDKFLQ